MNDTQPSLSFDDILKQTSLPEPGPALYVARRRLWLTPRVTPSPQPPSASRKKLEDLLNRPGAVYKPDTWDRGPDKVWRGLSSGGKLKYRLPLHLIVKIIHASWLRDHTWPVGMTAPVDSEEEEVVEVEMLGPPTAASVLTPTIGQ